MSRREFDSRGYQGGLERELILGGLIVGGLVGVGLIRLFWGESAMWTAAACLGGFALLIALIYGILKVLEWAGGKE